jgi:hypothetical protein
MRKFLGSILLTVLALAAALPASAQTSTDIAIDRAKLQSDYQNLVAMNLNISDEQGTTFWPLYREYRAEMQKIGDRVMAVVLDYAKNVDTMTDEQSTKMVDTYMTIKRDELKLKQSWLPKFRKALPAKSVARLYQIENKLDSMLMFSAALEVPLVKNTQ